MLVARLSIFTLKSWQVAVHSALTFLVDGTARQLGLIFYFKMDPVTLVSLTGGSLPAINTISPIASTLLQSLFP